MSQPGLCHRLYRWLSAALRDAFSLPQYDIWCHPGVWHPAEIVRRDLAGGVTVRCTVCTKCCKICTGEWVAVIRIRPREEEATATATATATAGHSHVAQPALPHIPYNKLEV